VTPARVSVFGGVEPWRGIWAGDASSTVLVQDPPPHQPAPDTPCKLPDKKAPGEKPVEKKKAAP